MRLNWGPNVGSESSMISDSKGGWQKMRSKDRIGHTKSKVCWFGEQPSIVCEFRANLLGSSWKINELVPSCSEIDNPVLVSVS